jgi:hypothetical protein
MRTFITLAFLAALSLGCTTTSLQQVIDEGPKATLENYGVSGSIGSVSGGVSTNSVEVNTDVVRVSAQLCLPETSFVIESLDKVPYVGPFVTNFIVCRD